MPRKGLPSVPRLHYRLLTLCPAAYSPCGPELAAGHRVSRPPGTGSVGDSVGEGGWKCAPVSSHHVLPAPWQGRKAELVNRILAA